MSMVTYLPPCSSSAGTRTIRHELQRRRTSKPLAPTGPVAKKPSASPPPRSAPSSPSSARGATPPGVPVHLNPGTVVRVRTRTATMKTGQVFVLWLRATVVSSSSDGSGFEVVYDANWPRGDPKSAVRVAPHQVRLINSSPAPTLTTPPPSLHPPTDTTVATTTKKEMPRPTTAGKSLRLIRSLFPEMELPAARA